MGSIFKAKIVKQFSSQKLLDNLCKLIDADEKLPTIHRIMEHFTFSIDLRRREDGSLTWYNGVPVGHISDTQSFVVVQRMRCIIFPFT